MTKARDTDSEEVDLSKPDACAKLIQRAHSTGGSAWNPLSESQPVAKAASIAAGNGRVVRIFRKVAKRASRSQVSDRLIGGVPPRELPAGYAERIVPQPPREHAPGVRPSGPPVPDRRSTEHVPGNVTIITSIDPPNPSDEPNT